MKHHRQNDGRILIILLLSIMSSNALKKRFSSRCRDKALYTTLRSAGQRRSLATETQRLTESRVEGETFPPLRTDTLSSYFRTELLEKLPSRPALIACKERPRAHGGPPRPNLGRTDCLAWSFEEFGMHVEKLAYGLLSMGVKTGDRVGVVMGNNSAYASLQWACARIGAILTTINPAYRTNELVSNLK